MPTIRVTTFFGSDAGRGWSESHSILGDDPVGNLLPYVQQWKGILDNFRIPLLAADRYCRGFRVAYPTANGTIASSPFRYTPNQYPNNKQVGCAPSSAAQVRFGEITNTQFSNSYLRGFWAAVQQNEQLNFTTAAGSAWKAILDQYTAALVQGGYGWDGIRDSLSPRGLITGYTIDPDTSLCTFNIVITNGVNPPATGQIITFRAARLNKSNSVLNRTLVCTFLSPTEVKTVNPIAADDFTSQGTFVMPFTDFTSYTGVQYTVLAKKSEGRPTGQSPARRRARART